MLKRHQLLKKIACFFRKGNNFIERERAGTKRGKKNNLDRVLSFILEIMVTSRNSCLMVRNPTSFSLSFKTQLQTQQQPDAFSISWTSWAIRSAKRQRFIARSRRQHDWTFLKIILNYSQNPSIGVSGQQKKIVGRPTDYLGDTYCEMFKRRECVALANKVWEKKISASHECSSGNKIP